MKNSVKEKLARKEAVVGTFFELGGLTAVECLGIAGLDFLIIDTEHGPFDVESTMDYIRMAELRHIAPFVRIKEVTRAAVLSMLDVGAQGLIIPCVETVEQVRNIVEYGKYTPKGSRGFIFGRAASYGFDEHAKELSGYFEHCNETTMLIPQCETKGCLEHIEEIVAMEGVDGIFVGPYDLSIAMGIPGKFTEPLFLKALDRVLTACKNADKPCFIYATDSEKARSYIAQGYEGVAVNMDAAVYIQAFRSLVREVKAEN